MNSTERAKFLASLHEVRDLIEGYVDVNDGLAGQPVPNHAMQATQLLDELLVDVSSAPKLNPNSGARLTRLSDARSTLPHNVRDEFSHILIGVLSCHISDEEWAGCLQTALLAIARLAEAKAVQA